VSVVGRGGCATKSKQAALKAPFFDGAADAVELCSNYIGVYWTFPAPGRYGLPSAADEAAKVSFTIDEQRRRTQRQARLWGLECAGEHAIQFNEPDLSDEDRARLYDIETACERGDTLVVVTKFTQSHNWRPNTLLDAILRNTGAPVVEIEPSGAVIDHFSLNRHWEECRRQIERARRAAKAASAAGQDTRLFKSGRINKVVADRFYEYLSARLNDIRDLDARSDTQVADRLNALKLYTLRGHRWDADAVRGLRRTLETRAPK
jgi:hypothetical protein